MSAPGLKITNFHYGNTAFEQPKVFVEFPKWVHMAGFESELVTNAHDEAVLRARDPATALANMPPKTFHDAPQPADAPSMTLVGTNDERAILWQIAEEKNIKIDRRWNLSRLRSTIERWGNSEGQE